MIQRVLTAAADERNQSNPKQAAIVPPRLELIEGTPVYKLIGIILAAVPIVLFLRAIMGQSRKGSKAVSDFKKHMDYVFWVIMLLMGCGVIYSLGKLLYKSVH